MNENEVVVGEKEQDEDLFLMDEPGAEPGDVVTPEAEKGSVVEGEVQPDSPTKPAPEKKEEGEPVKPSEGATPASPAAAPSGADSAYYDQVVAAGKDAVKRLTGEDFNEFDPKHQLILQDFAADVRRQREAKVEADRQADAAGVEIGKILDTEEAWAAHLARLDEMPAKEWRKINEAAAAGDYSLLVAAVRESKKLFDTKTMAGQKAKEIASRQERMPPAMVGAGQTKGNPSVDDDSDMALFGL